MEAAATLEYLPAAQSTQLPAEVEPESTVYAPAPQRAQVVAPKPVKYEPATQSEQLPTWIAPSTVEYFPGAQVVHVEEEVKPVPVK